MFINWNKITNIPFLKGIVLYFTTHHINTYSATPWACHSFMFPAWLLLTSEYMGSFLNKTYLMTIIWDGHSSAIWVLFYISLQRLSIFSFIVNIFSFTFLNLSYNSFYKKKFLSIHSNTWIISGSVSINCFLFLCILGIVSNIV